MYHECVSGKKRSGKETSAIEEGRAPLAELELDVLAYDVSLHKSRRTSQSEQEDDGKIVFHFAFATGAYLLPYNVRFKVNC